MANKVGPLIKEARGKAGLTQEQLAKQIEGLSASDISKAERGEKELSQAVLKQIAKLTGVTQSSLLNAAKESTYGAGKTTSAGKTSSSGKTSSTGKTSGKTSSSGKTGSQSSMKLSAADKETKEKAVKLLKGEKDDDLLGTILGTAMDLLGGKK